MNDAAAALAPQAWATLCEVRLRGTLHRPDPGHTGDLELKGYVVRRGDLVAITDAGRIAHAERARLVPGSPEEAAVREVYERFGSLNARLLRLCTDWQLRPGGVPNDHSDPDYDLRILDRLAETLDRACGELDRLAAADERFAGYRERLAAAMHRVDRGEHRWVASVTCDSVHTVWMLLHEELLCALGVSRADEQPVA
jgi:8-oxo-dGTP pyrophosphatase MutT (NUDIX family)